MTRETNVERALWLPIKTAPRIDGQKIVAYLEGYVAYPLICQCVYEGGHWWVDIWEDPVGDPVEPTHWIPQPIF
jgi:hypothetical protein